MSEPIVALVVAAGLGVRFGGPIPKPVTTLSGKAVVAMSVEALAAGGCTDAVVMIASGAEHHFAPALAASPIPITFVVGGASRQESVRLGLEAISRERRLKKAKIVLVHDAVRPLTPADVVERVINSVREGAVAVTPVIHVVDSIRQVDEAGGSTPIDRTQLRAVQTPQGFDMKTLVASHAKASKDGIKVTDDVSACEHAGHRVTMVPGAFTAIKITSATDLDLAEAFLRVRAGIGHHSGRRILRHRPFRWFMAIQEKLFARRTRVLRPR